MSDEMKCGIEIHQQLDTRKLFCSCGSELCDSGTEVCVRRLRPAAGETGETDRAALEQSKRGLAYRYQRCASSCLVETDDEPPHPVNADALETALTFAAMLGSDVADEIQFMRKIVVDGSNTSGFQRTSLIATGGSVDVNGRSIGVLSVCLEEDAARKIEARGDEVVYRLDRLGIPLIEVATAPDMRTPEEVMEVALRIGTLLRATKRVKRGIGTIREDLNISIPGGARIEIKGVQELRMLPDFVRGEIERQKMLLRVKGILAERGAREIPFEPVDATAAFEGCASKVVKGALDAGGRVVAVRLPGFHGVMNGDGGRLRLGAEMAQYARTAGVKGIFHSDELPNYGIEQALVDSLRGFLGIGPGEAFAICAAPEKRARDALAMAVGRANMALAGVPEETRDPQPDGTTRYSRPLPGAARMYPETDVPPEPVSEERMARVRSSLPELPEQTEARLARDYGVNGQQASQMVRRGRDALFARISDATGMAQAAATALSNTYSEMERDGLDPDSIGDEDVLEAFAMLKGGRFSKEAMPLILREMAAGSAPGAALSKLGLESVGEGDAAAEIARIVAERADFVRSKGTDAIGPLMGPVMGALRGRIDGKRASELLSEEIGKILSGA
ncbi:MAG: Glu-tRNA(Gln) amidotransferase subunit GatE [Candidatus Methanoplasma sp.]|jgi:glutamyl-tRNA(Gln) amidotransferase subunit E|nr:Glu-tRNA(Gln) amidotransferase subunit GatE [Candidatus Methanoplasma sp.]